MARTQQVNQWITTVQENLPHLSRPQATVLALWSFAAVMIRSCSLTLVTAFLAQLEDEKPNTVRQRLKEFYQDQRAKKGEKRQEIEVAMTLGPLFDWVLRLWRANEIALALDPTLLGDRWVALVISVVYRGGAIPVAWAIVPANEKGAWKPHWLAMLARLAPRIPSSMTVLVLTDRGLYAKWLFEAIQAVGFHPFMRINCNGQFRPKASRRWFKSEELVPTTGHYVAQRGAMFKTKHCRLVCTLLACWEEGHEQAWLILTDLAPPACDASWYGLRSWIEQGFKCIKTSGFQWQTSRMVHADRMERLWLVYAVATLWLVSVGGELEHERASVYGAALVSLAARQGSRRQLRVFLLGFLRVLVALIKGQVLPMPGALVPEAWAVPGSSSGGISYSLAA